jgi:monoamine oxidase
MTRPHPQHIVVIGAGAAGLMAARELARAGRRVKLLEARDRCGGRIYPLPAGEFGYAAEGGAEFIHGEAPVTQACCARRGLRSRRSRARHGQWRMGSSCEGMIGILIMQCSNGRCRTSQKI